MKSPAARGVWGRLLFVVKVKGEKYFARASSITITFHCFGGLLFSYPLSIFSFLLLTSRDKPRESEPSTRTTHRKQASPSFSKERKLYGPYCTVDILTEQYCLQVPISPFPRFRRLSDQNKKFGLHWSATVSRVTQWQLHLIDCPSISAPPIFTHHSSTHNSNRTRRISTVLLDTIIIWPPASHFACERRWLLDWTTRDKEEEESSSATLWQWSQL